ncbi:hypothetical protein GCM10009557_64470 [Virgisporangium ochraceum]|uniref:Uncharacterized protein n=1 Tax=Virgisporangium ochraceum TaxID=65505 RepID=A0A8J3ZMX0_9ACTN|nr:hypothetical protein Voc01_016510 [Virgisporangium ochraceum]
MTVAGPVRLIRRRSYRNPAGRGEPRGGAGEQAELVADVVQAVHARDQVEPLARLEPVDGRAHQVHVDAWRDRFIAQFATTSDRHSRSSPSRGSVTHSFSGWIHRISLRAVPVSAATLDR